MASTYEPIATTTLGSATASITFSSIPSTYTDLRIVTSILGTTNNGLRVHFNTTSLTGLYSFTNLVGDGTSATSGRNSNTDYISPATNVNSTTIPNFFTLDVFSYTGSTYKTILSTGQEDANGSGSVNRIVTLWRDTSAVTSVIIKTSSGTFAAGTTATLYGIKSA
jgi:hypothetical protein